ncbi:MAG: 30S ribosomal protein S20 [Ruminococcaceae bacterium]|nr:30S ribosomal protein S20 [Oscillospiraceae bacterium]MBQ2895216.1 30S ribosomal protein S20 [Oscillospiraceae bacterium]
MANIKSSAKRVLVSRAYAARNKADRSALKTSIKKFEAAAAESNRENAEVAYKAAVKSVDRAVSKGLIHKNNAAHKKSKMAAKLNAMAE